MKTAVCTLFEGNYHIGVASLINSLYFFGYEGEIYIGFRGDLPHWTKKAKVNYNFDYDGVKTLTVKENLILHFLELETNYSLTNYKPNFMLDLFSSKKLGIDNLFYFDPDIIMNKHWMHYLQWINCGVALCEDLNSPMPVNHPRRIGWRDYYSQYSIFLKYKTDIYVNGGFIGIERGQIEFLKAWKKNQELMAQKIGGLEKSIFSKNENALTNEKGFNIFDKTDQDALNVTVESADVDISIICKEAMGFVNGNTLMFHNLGQPKPWNKNYIYDLLVKGIKPTYGQKMFLKYLEFPIKVISKKKFLIKKVNLKLTLLLSRIIGK